MIYLKFDIHKTFLIGLILNNFTEKSKKKDFVSYYFKTF
jgi:hypothetical protein